MSIISEVFNVWCECCVEYDDIFYFQYEVVEVVMNGVMLNVCGCEKGIDLFILFMGIEVCVFVYVLEEFVEYWQLYLWIMFVKFE